jgi:hypothetical protein
MMSERNSAIVPKDEPILGSWAVFIGEQTPNGQKTTGNLHVTERAVYFEAGLLLRENAPADLSNRIEAFVKTDTHMIIPMSQIQDVSITKSFLILKTLNIRLKSGEQVEIRFGAMSPKEALSIIQSQAKIYR